MYSNKINLLNKTFKGLKTSLNIKLQLKKTLIFIFLLFSIQSSAQTKDESQVLKISKDLFRWEIENKFDSLANLFDNNLIVVGSIGTKRGKTEYLTDLKNGKPVHISITVQETSATITGTTAIVIGKGVFVTSVNDTQTSSNLSYMKVFVKEEKKWKLIALQANRLPE